MDKQVVGLRKLCRYCYETFRKWILMVKILRVSIAVFLFHFCDKDEFKHFLYNVVIEIEVT